MENTSHASARPTLQLDLNLQVQPLIATYSISSEPSPASQLFSESQETDLYESRSFCERPPYLTEV